MKKNNYPEKKNFEENLKFDEVMESALKNFDSLTKMQKRHLMEKLIKLADNPDEMWKAKEFAKKMYYDLTRNQNKAIISKLIGFSDSDLLRVKNYAEKTDLILFYLNKLTENEIGKVFT